jgi:hypothetical protein
MFMPLIETAIAFTVVMLAASLFVSAAVHVIQSLLKWRGRTVMEMLTQLMHGFQDANDDPDLKDPTKRGAAHARATQFASDLLSDPSLHSREAALEWQDDPDKLAQQVEYVHPEDVIALATNYTGTPDLPAKWVGDNKPYAKVKSFTDYVRNWFVTVEGTHAQAYKRKIRRLTLGVSCVVVVLFCLDGFQLIKTLWNSRLRADSLAKQAQPLQAVAARLDADTVPQLGLEMEKTATIIDEAEVGIGWQSSWMTRRWCAYRGACADPPPTTGRLLADALRWLFGLLFSCVMLSLGAPFWVTTLSSLIRLQDEVQKRKQISP